MAVRRNYRINLRNYGNPPAIMVSQYDENYDLVFEVYDGVVPATGLNTYTVKLVGRQPGDDPALKYEFTGTVSGIANNILSFTIDTTMTGRAGKGTAEIVILDTTNDVKFASFNLPVYVEKAAVPDDAIDADVERAQEIADEVQDIVDTAAATVKGEAESWAVGERDGEPVPSTDPTYHNNAKYYAEQAADSAASIGIDATLSISGKAADAKKTGDEISSLKEDLNADLSDIAVHGKNLFDVRRSSADDYYIRPDGTEGTRTGCSHSDYIAVNPSETIYVSRSLGSLSYPTIVQFDNTKTVISDSAIFPAITAAFSFTTESSTAYIVLNYATSYGANIIVSDVNSTFEEYKLIGSGNTSQLNLYSADAIYYDGTYLRSKSAVKLLTFKEIIDFGTSVSVGSGKFLYYDSTTKTLSASNDIAMSKDVYFVGILNTKTDSFSDLIKNRAVINYDAISNTVVLMLTSNTFLYSKGAYYTFASGDVTLTSQTAHFLLYYSIADAQFYVTSSYGSIKNDDIVIMEAFSGAYNAICPVRVINGQYAKSSTRLYTFGDSLTWYDTQNYTWGDHEGEQCIGFQTYLQRYVGLNLISNYGSSGKTTPQICSIIKNNIANLNPGEWIGAIALIMGGDNDDRLSVDVGTIQPVGSTFDTSTIYGALQDAIEALLTEKPTVRVVLMTEPMGWTYRNGQMVRVDEAIPNAYRNVAKLYGLPLIDLWNKSGINELTRSTYYADPLTNHSYFYHPNNAGWEQISKIICHGIMDV